MIKAGDYIQATHREFSVRTVTGTVTEPGDYGVTVDDEFYLADSEWHFEVIEKPVELPTGEHAVLVNPVNDRLLPIIRCDGWWVLVHSEGVERVRVAEVERRVRDAGYEVVFEGVPTD